jgi:hypothetical protein
MRTPALALAVLVAAPLAVAAPASAQAPYGAKVCSLTGPVPRLQKVIDLRPGSVLPRSKKRPRGAVKGRWTKPVRDKYGEPSWKNYGPVRTKAFAKNATICALSIGKGGTELRMRRTGLKGMRRAVNKDRLSREWGLRFDKKGKIVLAYQLWTA